MFESELLSSPELSDKRYYQLLKLECFKLVGLYVGLSANDDADGISTVDQAKAIFRSITEEKWGSADKTEDGAPPNA